MFPGNSVIHFFFARSVSGLFINIITMLFKSLFVALLFGTAVSPARAASILPIPSCCPGLDQNLTENLTCTDGNGITLAALPCSVDLANLIGTANLSFQLDGSLYLQEGIVLLPGSFCQANADLVYICPCTVVTCIRKCCPPGEGLEYPTNKSHIDCIPHDPSLNDLWRPTFDKPGMLSYTLFGQQPRCHQENGMYQVQERFVLDKNGQVLAEEDKIIIAEKDNYCLETILPEKKPEIFVCRYLLPVRSKPELLYAILFVIGALFLFFTLIFHLSMRHLCGSVHSKNMTNHLSCLLVGYIALAVLAFINNPEDWIICTGFALTIQFSFFAAFMWLNVMCIDIAWTFSSHKSPDAHSFGAIEGKKYLYYSLYVWLSSLALVLLTVLAEWGPIPSLHFLAPGFGANRCFFGARLPAFIFFYLPITLILIVNTFLFIFTTMKIVNARKNSAILIRSGTVSQRSRPHKFNELRFMLYFKLFLLMGITWIFEIISWAAVEDKYIFFYITDSINALRGVLIFFLFCIKKKMILQLSAKCSCLRKIQAAIENRKTSFQRGMSQSTTSQITSTQTTIA